MSLYLVRYSEIGLKRRYTRSNMESKLITSIKAALPPGSVTDIRKTRGRIFLETSADESTVRRNLSTVFGIKSFSPVYKFDFSSLADLLEKAYPLTKSIVVGKKFAVRCRRVGNHSFSSIDVERQLGELLVSSSDGVSLKSPDVEINIEIRNKTAYLYTYVILGPGGLPTSSQGSMVCLMSGGIDSPVASWMMMKRGVLVNFLFCSLAHPIDTVYFLNAAVKLTRGWLHGYTAKIHILDCRKFVEYAILDGKDNAGTVLFKLLLYKLAEKISSKFGYKGIITGESLGQVSSQTPDNLMSLSHFVDMPIYRPLIGFDKDEITDLARKIGTYPEKNTGEFCALFAEHARTEVPIEELEKNGIPEEIVDMILTNMMTFSSDTVDGFLKSLRKDEMEVKEIPENSLIVDLRDRKEYQRWHYKGAVNLRLWQLERLKKNVEHYSSIVFYCKEGLQSAYASSLFADSGTKVYYSSERDMKRLANQ